MNRTSVATALRDLCRWAGENRDLALLCALLVVTASFGRPFAKLGVGGIYVTEVVLVGIVILALRRTGLRGALDRIRRAVPLLPLGVFWLAGAIAAIRGIAGYGLDSTLKDIGLVEYSVFVPLVAVVADTRLRADALLRVLSYAGLAATVAVACVFFFAPDTPLGVGENPTSAVGVYLALFVLPVAARLAYGLRTARWELGVAAGAVLLMAFIAGRSVLVALVASLLVLAVLSPRPFRTAAIGLAGVALSVSVVVGLQTIGFGERGLQDTLLPPPASVGLVGSSLVLDDALDPAVGGKRVAGNAARGTFSREAAGAEPVKIALLKGLVPGETYTISFSVLPLDSRSTRGIVGNDGLTGWKTAEWQVEPTRTWQRVDTPLTATAPIERLVLVPDEEALGVRFDAVRITRGVAGPPPGDAIDRASDVSRPVPDTSTPPRESSLLSALVDSFDPNSIAVEYQNANWRLDYWNYLVRKTLHEPVLGAGFGRPAEFAWNYVLYDTRDSGPEAVSPPHNSFVNILFRTGVLGLAALVALLAIAVVRTLRLIGSSAHDERPPLVALLALVAFIAVTASLNVTLEGPYVAMFFWTVVGLLFVLPALEERRATSSRPG